MIPLQLKVNKWFRCLKTENMLERIIKSPFMIYADFESIILPEGNGKQNIEESYTNKYQKHVAWSYGYKLVCVDDNLLSLT